MLLKAETISFRYTKQGRPILRNFDFAMDNHEIVGITAPSGYGKTTLCKILAGYYKPENGLVSLDGEPVWGKKGYCPVQMIWQHPEQAVNPKLRMREVLEEGKGIEERILDGLGIRREWCGRFPSELSGGELQRFCIARALGSGTRFLLADEITTMLDLITQSQIWNFLLREAKQREIGIAVVSHSQDLLDAICSRSIFLI